MQLVYKNKKVKCNLFAFVVFYAILYLIATRLHLKYVKQIKTKNNV